MNSWLAACIDAQIPTTHSLIKRYRGIFAAAESGFGFEPRNLETVSITEGVVIRLIENLSGVRVLVCDESTNMSTGTYKDLDACLICADAVHKGVDTVVLSSGGNLGRAVSYYCHRAGLRVFLFHPRSTLHKLERQCFPDDTTRVICVDRHEREIKALARGFADTYGLVHVPDIRLRLAASAARAVHLLEILEQRGHIDWLAQAVCAAYGPLGIYQFFARLIELRVVQAGWIPAFLGVQQTANAPIAAAWTRDSPRLLPGLARSGDGEKYIEPGLYNTHPSDSYGQFYGLMKRFGCVMNTISEADFQAHAEEMIGYLGEVGFSFTRDPSTGDIIEKAGLLGAVGVSVAIHQRVITPGETVALLLTGGNRRFVERRTVAPDVLVDSTLSIDRWIHRLGEIYALPRPANVLGPTP